MIAAEKRVFYLETPNTSYWMRVGRTGILENLYYGRRIRRTGEVEALRDKHSIPMGGAIAYSDENPSLNLNNICLETSSPDVGDFRESSLVVEYGARGTVALNMLYRSHRILDGKPPAGSGLPESYGSARVCSTLEVTLADEALPLDLILYYTVFEDCDAIVRRSVLVNNSDAEVTIRNIASLQLDLFDSSWRMVSFDGAWARERIPTERALGPGTVVIDSKSGVSSSVHNPLVLLKRPGCRQDSGDCYGFNLVYSGNHREAAEVGEFGKLRFMTGINPSGFSWKLGRGESFSTPEAVETFSHEGTGGVSCHLRDFADLHIARGSWKLRERPVLLNSWEAGYYNLKEADILRLAKEGADLGVELFVLDDGWFGRRDDDTSSLGDWHANTEKIPSGIGGLSKKIHEMGLMFGLWVEPEMVSERSLLFQKHPDWRIAIPGRTPRKGRSQFILDLTRKEVRDHIAATMVDLFQQGGVDYVKWDMNRLFTDLRSETCPRGELVHRYCLGLYEVLERVTSACPAVLFESCAAGGGRFDLGMLSYMPQMWCSDNTDPLSRVAIQAGTAAGYPLSSIGAHVTASPNHQTLRISDLESRFNVACFGVLGYEMDLGGLTPAQKEQVRAQIAFYKAHRPLFQYGRLYEAPGGPERRVLAVADRRMEKIAVLDFQRLNIPNGPSQVLRLPFVDPEATYIVSARPQKVPAARLGGLAGLVSPGGPLREKVEEKLCLRTEETSLAVPGDILAYGGIKLPQKFGGSALDGRTRVLGDFDSRIYLVEKVGAGEAEGGR